MRFVVKRNPRGSLINCYGEPVVIRKLAPSGRTGYKPPGSSKLLLVSFTPCPQRLYAAAGQTWRRPLFVRSAVAARGSVSAMMLTCFFLPPSPVSFILSPSSLYAPEPKYLCPLKKKSLIPKLTHTELLQQLFS